MSILTVDNLVVNYGAINALKGISFEVNKGEIIALIGANGAGKTTTMNSIMGLIPKVSGTVMFDGRDITKADTRSIVKMGLTLAPEGRRIFPEFSVRDNLLMGGYLNSPKDNEAGIEEVVELFPVLKERMNQLGGTLSGGEQQMLAVGRAIIAKPKLLFLDEPSLGLAPLIIQEIFKLLSKIREMGMTIVLVEQNARQALKIADRGYVLEVGRIAATDTAENLLKSDAIIKAYLS